jgi:hypothetical protein
MIRTYTHVEGTRQPAKDGGSRWERSLSLVPGNRLLLVPEPDNPVDRNAILIYSSSDLDHEVGYMAASCAARICRMIECGATFSAVVNRIEKGSNGWHRVFFQVRQLTEMTSKKRPTRRGAPNYKRLAKHPIQRQVGSDRTWDDSAVEEATSGPDLGLIGWAIKALRSVFE